MYPSICQQFVTKNWTFLSEIKNFKILIWVWSIFWVFLTTFRGQFYNFLVSLPPCTKRITMLYDSANCPIRHSNASCPPLRRSILLNMSIPCSQWFCSFVWKRDEKGRMRILIYIEEILIYSYIETVGKKKFKTS